MNFRTQIMRFLSAPGRIFLFTPLMQFALRKMRDEPQIAADQPNEGRESLVDYPDFMLDRLAEGIAYAAGDDPTGIFKGNDVDARLVQKYMLKKGDAVEWFNNEFKVKQVVTEGQMKRDGSLLICRKALGRFESGMFQRARSLYERAIEIDATNSKAWEGLADVLDALKLIEEAKAARAQAELLGRDSEGAG